MQGHRITDQIKALRRQLAQEMGFVMPAVRILDNMQLGANEYRIRIKEFDSGKGELFPGSFLIMDPKGLPIDLPGTHTTEPAFGLPATWVSAPLREEASFRGFTVVDPGTVLTTHLTEVLKSHMAELLSYAETKKLLDDLPPENKKLVEELIPSQISVTGVQRVLQTLLSRTRLDPRPAGHPGRHRRSGGPHQERALHHRACAHPAGAPALPRQSRRRAAICRCWRCRRPGNRPSPNPLSARARNGNWRWRRRSFSNSSRRCASAIEEATAKNEVPVLL